MEPNAQALATRLTQHHERLRRSSTTIAQLAGLSRSYYVGLRTGQRARISIFKLRRLCEDGLCLSEATALDIFRERLQMGLAQRSPFSAEFFWRLARFESWEQIARLIGVDRSYIVKIVHGQRVPSFAVMQVLGQLLGYSEQESMRFQVACYRFQAQQARRAHPTQANRRAGLGEAAKKK